jgi:hypothetical protein
MKDHVILALSEKQQNWFELDIDKLEPFDIRYKMLKPKRKDFKDFQKMFWLIKKLY